MPSDPASAKPRSAATKVEDDVTLIAGYANRPAFARSSIVPYTSGVAIGTTEIVTFPVFVTARGSKLAIQYYFPALASFRPRELAA